MKLLKYLLLVIIAFSFSFCNRKDNSIFNCDECFSYAGATVRIVRASDGKDLVFGPNRTYNRNNFKFYTLKGMDTTFFDYQAFYPTSGTSDSAIGVTFIPGTATAYLRLSDGDIDTLSISYQFFEACCGTISNISSVKVNNTTDVQGANPLIVLRK